MRRAIGGSTSRGEFQMTRVAIQGIRGSYSEEAATKLLGESAEIIECSSFAEAIDAVRTLSCYALVPVANTIVGNIGETDELIATRDLRINDEIALDIEHVLAGAIDAEFSAVEEVVSHPVALQQCRRFFDSNPQVASTRGIDTASSIRDVVKAGLVGRAAIGSRRAAEMYGAKVLLDDIADSRGNRTTFYLVGK